MKKVEERRRFIRLEVPVELKYIVTGDPVRKEGTTKDLSCEGLRFTDKSKIKEGDLLEINLDVPHAPNSVHINAKVVWLKKLSTEDDSPSDIGVEFTKIEEDNKNTFLKYLCDIIYGQTEMMKHDQKK